MENLKEKIGEGQSVNVDVKGNFEGSQKPVTAQMMQCDPSLQQEEDDKNLLVNIGDSYSRVQKGTIYSSDGETKIAVDLTFTRIRNKQGGVDVVCSIPCLGSMADAPLGVA